MLLKEFIVSCGESSGSSLYFYKKGERILVEIKHGSGFSQKEREADAQAKAELWQKENPAFVYSVKHDEICVYKVASQTGWYADNEFASKNIEQVWEDATYLYCADFSYNETRCVIKKYNKSNIGTSHTITSDGYIGWAGGDRVSLETHHYSVVLNPDLTVTKTYMDTTTSVVGQKSFMGGWV